MSDEATVVELCLTRDQTITLSLLVHGSDLIAETLAEGLYAAKLQWEWPAAAAPIIIRKMAKFYTTELALGSLRSRYDDVIVVDFVSRIVSDRTQGRSYTFKKWLHRQDVP